MALPVFQTAIRELSMLQTSWTSQLNPLLADPFLQGGVLPSIGLFSGSNTINTNLNRALQGWVFTRVRASYTFTVTSANATIGAVYTNNSVTFVVLQTIASGATLYLTYAGIPASSGTLTKVSGTGDSTISFSSFANTVANVFDTQDSNKNPSQTLLLTASAPVVVDLYVF